jgi:hypothetical protein
MLLTATARLDEVLHANEQAIGRDFVAYRNHAYRVLNLCVVQSLDDPENETSEQLDKMAIATAFHDLGIWTDGTFDYLQPSVRLANAYLVKIGNPEWTPEISEMILQHHKISRFRGDARWLVEPFRRSDWIDVTRGLLTFGLPRRLLRDVFSMWPSAGFHKRLLELELAHLRAHPGNPLPMMKL